MEEEKKIVNNLHIIEVKSGVFELQLNQDKYVLTYEQITAISNILNLPTGMGIAIG